MQILDLNGTWELRQPGQNLVIQAQVPGQVQWDLLRAGLIQDPYVQDHETEDLWISRSAWEYSRTFSVSPEILNHRQINLVCDGLDTIASVVLNGTQVAECDNMFRRYVLDAKPHLRPGENHLQILFRPVLEYADAQAARYPHAVPGNTYFLKNDHHNFIRKSGCHFGWDWGPCLMPVGIWRSIRLEAFNEARLTAMTHQQFHTPGNVRLAIRVFMQSPGNAAGELTLTLDEQKKTQSVALRAGENVFPMELSVENPKLWWPKGHGEQPLSKLTAEFAGQAGEHERISQAIGFRQIELVQELDEHGEGFYFKVNQVPVFAKGANWIPADAFDARVDRARLRNLLSSAAQANMNLLRVWGGGIYEQDDFYALCDEMGLLVWQDFMFACALYPADKAFCRNVEKEARQQTRRLSHHACLALWCGNNENEEGLVSWYPEVKKDPALYWQEYHQLFLDTLGQVVREEDPGRQYWPSSPSNGPGAAQNPNDPTRGDTHAWSLWYSGLPLATSLLEHPRFVSEFGFQSYPSRESLAKVLGPNDWDLTSAMVEYRQRCPYGNRSIFKQLVRWFNMPKRFEDFLYISQVLQALMNKLLVEHWRRSRPTCMGIVYWQLNDIWQGPSWSSLEYSGAWKLLHYFAVEFFSPILVSAREAGEQMEVWITNDLQQAITGQVEITLWSWSGDKIKIQTEPFTVPARSNCRAWETTWAQFLGPGAKRSECLVQMKAVFPEGQCANVHFPSPLRQINLFYPRLEIQSLAQTGKDFCFTLSSDQIAPFVSLSAGKILGRFSENGFTLFPGQNREIWFYTWEHVELEAFQKALQVRSLRDSYN